MLTETVDSSVAPALGNLSDRFLLAARSAFSARNDALFLFILQFTCKFGSDSRWPLERISVAGGILPTYENYRGLNGRDNQESFLMTG